MSAASRVAAEHRVLILAPTGRDGQLTQGVLRETGIRALACENLAHLARELPEGAGALLLSEEAVRGEADLFFIGERLSRQPAWSDLPVLLLAHSAADSSALRKAIRSLGNVTLLDRPIRVASLLSSAQTALRARERQYHARERLQELDDVARALTDSEARLQALFANAAVGIAELADGGKFAMVNDALCRIVGRTREALMASCVFDHILGEDLCEMQSAYHEVVNGRRANFSGEHRFAHADGKGIWAKVSITAPPRAHDDARVRAVAVIEDVTERRTAEDDLRDADRRKDEFIATLAHELRNPLAPIRNSLHIVRLAGSQEPAIQRVADMMERQVKHMVRMVDDLLEVSRISRGKIELRKERVELAAIVRSALETSRPLIEAGGHELSLSIEDEAIGVDADPVRLGQVFANLINNSAKYTPAGGRIEVNVSTDEGMARIFVKDNGEGIPAEMLDKVFDMFTQVDAGSRAQGGLGIGLTLARTLVHLHGGTIEARSPGRGRGCDFLVRLPRARGATAPIPAPAPAVRYENEKLRRVLVVDDNYDAADSLGMLLQFLGAEAMTVHDGRAALDAARAFQPAVMLLDLGMPGMSGLELARRVREDPALRNTTLVALTGWGQREDRRRSEEAGFDYHLVKPADLPTLQSILRGDAAPGVPGDD
ncbi:MAG: ATP-binding protein [Usitatibacter sp.]